MLMQIGRLQPYVRPLSAASWPLALMIIADRIPNHAIALIGAGLHGLSNPRPWPACITFRLPFPIESTNSSRPCD
jgi:hypothetical protein